MASIKPPISQAQLWRTTLTQLGYIAASAGNLDHKAIAMRTKWRLADAPGDVEKARQLCEDTLRNLQQANTLLDELNTALNTGPANG